MDLEGVLNALPDAVIVVDQDDAVRFVNSAAEVLLQASLSWLKGRCLNTMIPGDHPVHELMLQVREGGYSVAEHDLSIETLRIHAPHLNIQIAPVVPGPMSIDRPGWLVLSLTTASIASKIDQQLTHRNAARSVTAMASVLAHEVKNPLAGIRGAAQLLESGLEPADRTLTQLICDEADRIVALIDRMSIFSDHRQIERQAINVHEILDHVKRVAQSSFARDIRLSEQYDPSLPPVLGHRDQLVQIFMNLMKNAADAVPADRGEITVTTAYRHGVRLAMPGSERVMDLPLMVAIRDNGSGIPEDLQDHLFDPFVTTKADGHGLGLALVAKIVGDHGGIIEFDSDTSGTTFRVLLPIADRVED